MIDDATKSEIKKRLSSMNSDVEILFFPGPDENSTAVKEMLADMTGLSPKLKIVMHNEGAPETAQFAIENVPVMIFRGEGVQGDARFYGFPGGYEFPIFIESIGFAGGKTRTGPLSALASEIKSPITIETFVTPQCPYCPTATFETLKLAMMSKNVNGYAYDIAEFPLIMQRYRVQTVPKMVINKGKFEVSGAQSEDVLAINLRKMLPSL